MARLLDRANLHAAADPSSGMALTLYALDGCPYCEKVHDALEENGIDYETVWVDAMHSDRDEVKRVSGQRGVPVLIDEAHGVTMNESENILQYVERTLA
jgi:glutaredoxin